jgi:hypothetical protein
MGHATRRECQEVKELGASVPLYRRIRRAGASHDEVVAVLRGGRSFLRYELLRTAGASHASALALESRGIDAISYRDLRRIGVGDDEVEDAERRGLALDVYYSARNAGLTHDDAATLVDAGLRHANARAWRTAARARHLFDGRARDTRTTLELLARRAPAFKGSAEDLADEVAAAVTRSEAA